MPYACKLVAWDAQRFCQLLGTRKVLAIGDSTMLQAASVLMNYIHWGYWGASPPGCQSQV